MNSASEYIHGNMTAVTNHAELYELTMGISQSFTITANPDRYSIDTVLEAHKDISNCPDEISCEIFKAVEKNNHICVFHIWRGLINMRNGRFQEAEFDFLRAEKCAGIKDWQPSYLLAKVRQFRVADIKFRFNKDRQTLGAFTAAIESAELSKNSGEVKILFYYDCLAPPGQPYAGTNAVISSLAQSVVKRDNRFRVDLMGKLIEKEIHHNGIRMLPVPSKKKRNNLIERYDVILVASHLGFLSACEKRDHQKWILYQHCWKVEKNELEKIKRFDAVICLSEVHKKEVIAQGVNGDVIDVFANNIDTRFYKPNKVVQRKRHSILFAGAIVPYKRIDVLFGAFGFIRKKYPDATLDIYGGAAMWHVDDEYESKFRKLNCPIVRYHGAVHNSRMPDIYSENSIICIPSTLESFSMVSIEAQACGCVVVAHDIGGIPVTIPDTNTGFLYSPNTAENLAAAIHTAFRRINEDKSIRDRCRQFVCDNFDLERNVGKFMDILEKRTGLCQERLGPS